jgi:thiamine-monophosphate kinase
VTDEFSLIAKYFAPLSSEIGDDCAIVELQPGERLATSIDTMVEGTHFDRDAPPDQVAYRAVVSALSDLAAMGAAPRALTLALTLPEANETFLQQFSRGIEQATAAYGVELVGGDTTRGPLTITCTVMGAVPLDQALTRAGARPGDGVFLSGTTGDAAAALTVIAGEWTGHSQYRDYLLGRFYRPTARIELGRALLPVASSAIDVSDGVLADAAHLCEQSGVGIRIESGAMPLSPALLSMPDSHRALTLALSGGEDYELLFTVPPDRQHRLPEGCTRIGEVTEGSGVSCDMEVVTAGYTHFSASGESSAPVSPAGPAAHPAGPGKPSPFRSFCQFFAFGFGSGLSPKAPGTVGTLAAIPLFLLASTLNLPLYSGLLLLTFGAGIFLCERASRELGVHDHPGIVWDEFVGFWITMWAVPLSWQSLLAGFALFRLFDIAKPWPIRWLDRRVGGGFGIMIDDVLAGLISCALLHFGWYGLTGAWAVGGAGG